MKSVKEILYTMYSLNSIIKELYLEKYEKTELSENEMSDSTYKNFEKDTTKKIKSDYEWAKY